MHSETIAQYSKLLKHYLDVSNIQFILLFIIIRMKEHLYTELSSFLLESLPAKIICRGIYRPCS